MVVIVEIVCNITNCKDGMKQLLYNLQLQLLTIAIATVTIALRQDWLQTYQFHNWHQCIQEGICMCIRSLYHCMSRHCYMDCCCTRLCLQDTITFQRNEMNIEYNKYTPVCRKCDTMTTVGYDDQFTYRAQSFEYVCCI